MSHRGLSSVVLGLATLLLAVSVAAQEGGDALAPSAPLAAENEAAAPAQVLVPAQGPVTATTTTTYQTGRPSADTDLEEHLGRSSHALTDIHQGDAFDYGSGSEGSKVVRGRSDALGITTAQQAENSGIYVVRKGDTLSNISQRLYGQPWNWPKLWSLNPQIQNPHWIYPGDQIRLTEGGLTPVKTRQTKTLGSGGLVNLRPAVDPRTVFLRNMAYIDDPAKGVMGEVVGSKEPVQLMTEHQSVYVVLRPGVSVEAGQQLSVFRMSRRPPKVKGARTPPGYIIRIDGTIEVEYFNPKTRIVRGVITESLDVIERGAKVGNPTREFALVAPQKTTKNITTRVIASLYPHVNISQYQVVFIDRGAKDGLQAGNRLFVIRRGDTWRRTLETARSSAYSRVKLDVEGDTEVEPTPLHGDEQKFPEEVIAELRVIETHPFSALAVVTRAQVEVQPGDRAVARTGF